MITIQLTTAEARNLLIATSNTLEHPDALVATFPNASARRAACRAASKVAAGLPGPRLLCQWCKRPHGRKIPYCSKACRTKHAANPCA